MRELNAIELKSAQHNAALNAIVELSTDGFVVFDQTHCVSYINPAFCDLTGLSATQLIGADEQAFAHQLNTHCQSRDSFIGMAQMRENAQSPALETRTIIELRPPQARILELTLREGSHASVAQVLYCRDISRQTEIDRNKNEFLSTAAHELRTPMASIYGFAELLQSQEFTQHERSEFLRIIYAQSELMISIINELLDLARLEARQGKDFQIKPCNINELLHEVLANFKRPNHRQTPAVLNLQRPVWINGDPNKLTQALNNILSNAYKYSPDGGTVSIQLVQHALDHESAPGQVGIQIADQGIGMTEAQLARVFERFYRADASSNIPGTGLGMSIVKEIIELHGGEVTLTSTYQQGTTVTIWLPLAA